jgi:hypothetical protein
LSSTHNNWPNPEGNHGAAGTGMNFCSDYLDVLNTRQDGNNTEPGT